jgi:hypothetical protein
MVRVIDPAWMRNPSADGNRGTLNHAEKEKHGSCRAPIQFKSSGNYPGCHPERNALQRRVRLAEGISGLLIT